MQPLQWQQLSTKLPVIPSLSLHSAHSQGSQIVTQPFYLPCVYSERFLQTRRFCKWSYNMVERALSVTLRIRSCCRLLHHISLCANVISECLQTDHHQSFIAVCILYKPEVKLISALCSCPSGPKAAEVFLQVEDIVSALQDRWSESLIM